MILVFFTIFVVNTISIGLTRINPLVPQNNSIVQIDDSTFELKPHTSFGNCSCDISNSCDPYCCCDPDCQGVSFPYCIDSQSTSSKLRMCSDQDKESGGKVIEWFLRTSLCIQRNNNPSPGDFYDLNLDIDYNNIPFESNPSSLYNIFVEDDPSSSSNVLRPFQNLNNLLIPRRLSTGQCENKPMLYLESIDETCSSSSANNTKIINLTNLSTCNGNISCITDRVTKEIASYESYGSVHVIVKWGVRPQNMSPTGYHFGEAITNGNGDKILLGDKCIAPYWQNFDLIFGKQTDIICQISESDNIIFQHDTDDRGQNITFVNFSNITLLFPYTNYSSSPYVNDLPENIGIIREEIPDPVIVAEGQPIMITQSLSIIYKSIGPKENPQRIISDFKINYFTSNAHNASLRMVARFYEQPNELNIFDNPSMSDVHQWLPF